MSKGQPRLGIEADLALFHTISSTFSLALLVSLETPYTPLFSIHSAGRLQEHDGNLNPHA
jgi:hypothetical protein